MGGHVSNVYYVLGIAFVLANVCIWSSFAEDNYKLVKFAAEEEKQTVPHTVLARRAPGENDAIKFVYDDSREDNVHERNPNEGLDIPLDIIQRINNIENLTQLSGVVNDYFELDLANRFGESDEQIDRKGAVMAKPASCKPELVTVPLHNTEDKSVFYYPSCTRVERCGGCCSHDLLACQPTATEMINYQVIVTKYEGGSKLNYKGKEIVSVEQHTKCKCDCKVKEKDCNSLQLYNKAECRCVCMNVDEEQKCLQENDTKLWDPNECICACRQTKECSTGFYFDQKTCGCTQVPIIRRRVSDANLDIRFRRGENSPQKYRLSPRAVTPLRKVEETSGV